MSRLNRHDPATAIPLLEKQISSLRNDVAKTQNVTEFVENQKMYRVDIYASNGNMLRGGITSTKLSALLYSWDREITGETDDTYFTWTRNSGNKQADDIWNSQNGKGTKSIIVVKEDVGEQSTFLCTVSDGNKMFAQAQIVVTSNFSLEGIVDSVDVITKQIEAIEENVDTAQAAADAATEKAESALTQMDTVNAEIAAANSQIEELNQSLETVTETMEAEYATKGELIDMETDLSVEIEKNAAGLTAAVTRVDQIEIDSAKAIEDASAAAEAAETAQTAADTAQRNLEILQQQADATDEQLAAAQEAVETAQAAADAAADAAETAQAAADSLGNRVLTAETQIEQLSSRITLTVKEVETTKKNAVNSVVIKYALSDSATTAPTTGWSTTAPEWQDGKHMWQQTTTTKGDNTETVTTTCISGAKGATGAKGDEGEDAIVLQIDSSRGNVFKNSSINTVLTVTIHKGLDIVTDITTLQAEFSNASLEWSQKKNDSDTFVVIPQSDSRISESGFKLSVSSSDVDTKTVFKCNLIVP